MYILRAQSDWMHIKRICRLIQTPFICFLAYLYSNGSYTDISVYNV